MIEDVLHAAARHLDEVRPPIGQHCVVQLGSRWLGRAILVLFAPGADDPALVIKVDRLPRHHPRLRQELAALQTLERRADLRGLVPEPLGLFPVGDALALAQTGIGGTPLTVVLRRRLIPSLGAAEHDHQRVLGWVERLHGPVGPSRFEVLEPADVMARVGAALPQEGRFPRFVSDVRTQAETFGCITIPVLPGHGDLGPSNFLLRRGEVAGVVDWEGGVEQRSPLADLVIFLNHYVRATPDRLQRPVDPGDAIARAFVDDGWLGCLTRRSWRRQLRRLGLPDAAERYLLTATLAALATGHAPIAHAQRGRKMWTGLFRHYANAAVDAGVT